MQEPKSILKHGTQIITHEVLGSTGGLLVAARYRDARRPSAKARLGNVVPGHGGDAYWAIHEDESVAIYGWQEFELADAADAPIKLSPSLWSSLEYAAKAAYEALDAAKPQDWEGLADARKEDYRVIARKVLAAGNMPFGINMSIKVPHQHPASQNIQWNLAFGSSDAEIIEAAERFVQMMQELRGNPG